MTAIVSKEQIEKIADYIFNELREVDIVRLIQLLEKKIFSNRGYRTNEAEPKEDKTT